MIQIYINFVFYTCSLFSHPQSHMTDQEVPRDMQKRVIDYYNYLWVRSRGQDVKNLFKDAPYCLRSEIYFAVMQDMLENVRLVLSFYEDK